MNVDHGRNRVAVADALNTFSERQQSDTIDLPHEGSEAEKIQELAEAE